VVSTEVVLLLPKESQMFSKICLSVTIHGLPKGADRLANSASYWIIFGKVISVLIRKTIVGLGLRPAIIATYRADMRITQPRVQYVPWFFSVVKAVGA
jgi:hypothetical protein